MDIEQEKLVFIHSDLLKETPVQSIGNEKKSILLKPDKYKRLIFEKEKPVYFECSCINAIFPARLVFTRPNI